MLLTKAEALEMLEESEKMNPERWIEHSKKVGEAIYEKIINFCDLICTNKFMILEQRLIEIMTKRGVDTNTVYHITQAQKLKAEIDHALCVPTYSMLVYNLEK